ncbi:hypothetical protein H8959_010038 [Pygathrix nigripes]
MESIRWLLAAAGEEFEEEFLETREQYEKLQNDGRLLFSQVPLVEMDGMVLTQTRAILGYLAAKYNFYGKDLKERVRIDMYIDGTQDLMMMIIMAPFKSAEEKKETLASIMQKAKTRYLPAFEKILVDDLVFFISSFSSMVQKGFVNSVEFGFHREGINGSLKVLSQKMMQTAQEHRVQCAGYCSNGATRVLTSDQDTFSTLSLPPAPHPRQNGTQAIATLPPNYLTYLCPSPIPFHFVGQSLMVSHLHHPRVLPVGLPASSFTSL